MDGAGADARRGASRGSAWIRGRHARRPRGLPARHCDRVPVLARRQAADAGRCLVPGLLGEHRRHGRGHAASALLGGRVRAPAAQSVRGRTRHRHARDPERQPLHPRRGHRLDEGGVRHLRGRLQEPRQAVRRVSRRAAPAVARRHGGVPRTTLRLPRAADFSCAAGTGADLSRRRCARRAANARRARPMAGSARATCPRKYPPCSRSSRGCARRQDATTCPSRP